MKNTKTECCHGISFPVRTQRLMTNVKIGEHKFIKLKGPGLFLSAQISKQSGNSDISFVDLRIYGNSVFNLSYASMVNLGFTQQNPYGMVLVKTGEIENVTLGFPYTLKYEKSLELSFTTREERIKQVIANGIFGKD